MAVVLWVSNVYLVPASIMLTTFVLITAASWSSHF